MNLKVKLKKGDEVIVLAGKDKGKTGKISNLAIIMDSAKCKKKEVKK